MFDIFIKKPVLSTVIAILIVILGLLGLSNLPIEQYPDIAPPTVKVTATYIGAGAETLLKSVITPLEESINGVEGMTYMTSTAASDGTATITVYFDLSMNPDIATVNVQNRVSKASNLLPPDVIQTGVTVVKTQTSSLVFAAVYSTIKEFDDVFVQNYAQINLIPKLQRVKGVGDVTVYGAKDYSMRIWLDPKKMANYGLMPSDIQRALKEQNVEAAVGKFGEHSSNYYEYTIKYKGRLSKTEEYEDIVVKSLGGGKYLKLKDVANIQLQGYNYATNNLTMGRPSIVFAILQVAGSNANAIIEESTQILEDESKNFPAGIEYVIPYNIKDFLDASIHEVTKTLIEAFILVFVVVFVFLQDIRSTIIPIITVPVSLIGTFFFLNIAGYTLNMLTLFALVLAIGIVVDDAIVVVEAIYGKLESGAKSAAEASRSAMKGISSAIISITLVLIAVFVPVMFIGGSSGRFYQQFAVTLVFSVLISAINALTLSPALCAVLLRPKGEKKENEIPKNILQRFFYAFNKAFGAMTEKYVGTVKVIANKKWIAVMILGCCLVMVVFFFKKTPSGFIPNEDRGIIFLDMALPPGSSLKQTEAVIYQFDSMVATMPAVSERMFSMGNSMLKGISGPSYALGALKLTPWDDRKTPETQIDALLKDLYAKAAHIKNANFLFFTPPSVSGFGNADGFQFKLLNKKDDDWATMDSIGKQFIKALMARPEIAFVSGSFNSNFPQYELEVNVEKVKDAGLTMTDIFNTMQGYFGGLYTTDFNRFGKQYKVMIEAAPQYRIDQYSLKGVYVNNAKGESVSIGEFVRVKRVYAPEIVSRYNLFKSNEINGTSKPGFSTGDAIAAIQDEEKKTLPPGYSCEFTGLSREELISQGQALGIFLLSGIFVYFILAALYESYILPLAVLVSLIIGVMGAITFVYLLGLENNIYFQVALIMLLGLLGKNAILIVEFALQERAAGKAIFEAAMNGARERLRPILMTSFAFILGILPLVFANGVGAVGSKSIGTGAMGGLLVGTSIGILVIPVLFIVFQGLQEKWFGNQTKS